MVAVTSLLALSLLITLALLFLMRRGGEVNGADIAHKAFPSVVRLDMDHGDGKGTLGSGFFVRQDIVATSHHVIKDAVRGYAKIINQDGQYEIMGHVGLDVEHDLALLKLKGANALVLPLGDASKVQVGDEVFAIGNPQGLEGTFSNGIVSSVRKHEKDRLFQVTAPISKGSSGGPVLNAKGDVIGVAFATTDEGQNLNFVIPSAYLRDLLARMTTVSPLGTP